MKLSATKLTASSGADKHFVPNHCFSGGKGKEGASMSPVHNLGDCCDCCVPGAYFTSGLPGVLAHVENRKIIGEVERCDACERFSSDEEARIALEKFLSQSQSQTQHIPEQDTV